MQIIPLCGAPGVDVWTVLLDYSEAIFWLNFRHERPKLAWYDSRRYTLASQL